MYFQKTSNKTLGIDMCSILKCEKTKTFDKQIRLVATLETSHEPLGHKICSKINCRKQRSMDFKMLEVPIISHVSEIYLNNFDIFKYLLRTHKCNTFMNE